MKLICVFMIFLVSIAFGVYTFLNIAQKDILVFSTGGKAGLYYPMGSHLGSLVQYNIKGIAVSVATSSGSEENVELLSQGKADLAFVQNDVTFHKNISTIMPVYDEYLFVIVNPLSGIESLDDLSGKSVANGLPNSGTRKISSALLHHFQINQNDIDLVSMGFADCVDALKNNKIDACFIMSGINSSACNELIQNNTAVLISALPRSVETDALKGFLISYPFADVAEIPAYTYGRFPKQAVSTVSTKAVLAARQDMDPDLIRNIVGTLYKDRAQVMDMFKIYDFASDKINTDRLQFSLHPGVLMYMNREDPSWFVKYAESMSFVITLILALFSCWLGIKGVIYNIKKNRVDKFYMHIEQVMIRKSEAESVEDLIDLRDDLIKLRKKAFQDLVDEKLIADESFSIFQDALIYALNEIREGIGAGSDHKINKITT